MLDAQSANSPTGGASYDALIGFTAKSAGATLLTRDLRAIPTAASRRRSSGLTPEHPKMDIQ